MHSGRDSFAGQSESTLRDIIISAVASDDAFEPLPRSNETACAGILQPEVGQGALGRLVIAPPERDLKSSVRE